MRTVIDQFYGPPKPDAMTVLEAQLTKEATKLTDAMRPQIEAAIARGEQPAFLIRQAYAQLAPIHAELVDIYARRPLPPVLVRTVP